MGPNQPWILDNGVPTGNPGNDAQAHLKPLSFAFIAIRTVIPIIRFLLVICQLFFLIFLIRQPRILTLRRR